MKNKNKYSSQINLYLVTVFTVDILAEDASTPLHHLRELFIYLIFFLSLISCLMSNHGISELVLLLILIGKSTTDHAHERICSWAVLYKHIICVLMKRRFGKLVNLDMRRISAKFIKNTMKRQKQETRKIAREREKSRKNESINDGSTKKVSLFHFNLIISDTSVLGSSERCSRNVHSSVELILSVGGRSASILMDTSCWVLYGGKRYCALHRIRLGCLFIHL